MASLRPDPDELRPSIAYERAPLADFPDIDLVLLTSILRSGLAPRDDLDRDERAHAARMQARLKQALEGEIRHRRLSESAVAGRLIERAMERLR